MHVMRLEDVHVAEKRSRYRCGCKYIIHHMGLWQGLIVGGIWVTS